MVWQKTKINYQFYSQCSRVSKKLIVSREYYSQTHIYASGSHKNCPEKIREYHWNWSGEKVINQKLIEAKERMNANKKLQETTARTSL